MRETEALRSVIKMAESGEMREAWGKLDGERTHPLAHHCMDVAAVFARMIELPVLHDRLEKAAGTPLSDVQRHRLSALVFLHDIGKLHPGFQAKGWPKGAWSGPMRGHLKESWAFLTLACKWPDHPFNGTMRRIMTWGEAVGPLVAAVFAHHGRPVSPSIDPTLRSWDSRSLLHYDWRAEARAIAEALTRWFAEAFDAAAEPLPDKPRFHHAVAGLAALADWIGSDQRFFEFQAPFDPGYDVTAHRRAAQALSAVGLDVRTLAGRRAPDFREMTGFEAPRPAQDVVGAVGSEAQLVILEAETGSGKTEAALWRFAQLFAAGKVSGLYFAVPTRAAARQLHRRVVEAMQRTFGEDAPEPVLTIPGMLRAGEFDGHRLPGWEVRWDDDRDTAPRRWAAEHATRFLAATIAVGTVDQAMLAGLRVKHAHLRGSALSRSILVIDEVHASDAYMTEVLKRLLDGHLAVGGYAMLMSATLGARARVRWTGEALPDFTTAHAAPYPAVWVKGELGPRAAGKAEGSKTAHLEAVPTMEPVVAAARAISAAKHGARVLVIRNTVSTAVATWRAVLEAEAESLLMQVEGYSALHHGRFAAEDRLLLDRAVEAALKPEQDRECKGCIVIGTQTLEQSLDIDADFLVTDLCPMDVLLQRIGRLHRHDIYRRPSDFDFARVAVLLPEDGLDPLAKPAFKNGLGAWETPEGINGIYRDLAGLELTWRAIARNREWRIPQMNRALVEGATHPEHIDALIEEKGEVWKRYERKVGGAALAEGMIADLNSLDREERFEDATFPDSDERIVTRLGEEGVVLTFDPPSVGPFGVQIERIALPARWSRGIGKDEPVRVSADREGLVLSVGERRFRYSREGLHRVTDHP
ncbi:MAG: CRISPR-associated helicase Cas3' [Rhodospirillales bacterium]|nr:CRISPR-associated helicase Cas3' [Rhodospirillales bacterium]